MESDEIQWAGVKNTSGEVQRFMQGGRVQNFAKDETKVVKAEDALFLTAKNHLSSDGKLVTRKYLFQSVSLTEALKHVKEPENKSIAAAKKAAEQKDKEKAAWKAEILAELKAEGALKK